MSAPLAFRPRVTTTTTTARPPRASTGFTITITAALTHYDGDPEPDWAAHAADPRRIPARVGRAARRGFGVVTRGSVMSVESPRDGRQQIPRMATARRGRRRVESSGAGSRARAQRRAANGRRTNATREARAGISGTRVAHGNTRDPAEAGRVGG